jgi:hypothetical protein
VRTMVRQVAAHDSAQLLVRASQRAPEPSCQARGRLIGYPLEDSRSGRCAVKRSKLSFASRPEFHEHLTLEFPANLDTVIVFRFRSAWATAVVAGQSRRTVGAVSSNAQARAISMLERLRACQKDKRALPDANRAYTPTSSPRRNPNMAGILDGKVALITGAGSGDLEDLRARRGQAATGRCG